MKNKWITILVINCLLSVVTASYGSETRAVWSANQGTKFDLFESVLTNGAWTKPALIVAGSKEDDITPAVTEDHQGRIWLLWIARDDKGCSQLRFNIRKSGDVVLSGSISSGFDHNYSPSVLVDRKNTIWASWSSFDGTNEEIYASYFDGNSWLPATRVSNGDAKPNIKPLLSLGVDGVVQISWSRLDVSGYQLYRSFWWKDHFENETTMKDNLLPLTQSRPLCSSLLSLPEETKESHMITVFQPTNEGLQSTPEWVPPCNPKVQP